MSLGIRAKLMSGFGAVLLCLAIVGGVGYRNTTKFAAEFQSLYQGDCMLGQGHEPRRMERR